MKAKAGEPLVQAPEIQAVNEAEGPVVIKLTLPGELYAEYKDLADKQELTPAELMIHRLSRCRTHSSVRSLYFSQQQLSRLEQLLQKRPIENSEQALALMTAAFSFQLGEFPPVPLTPAQAKRIHLGAFGGQTAYDRLCYIVQGAVSKMTGA